MRAPTVIAISAMAHVALFAALSQIALPRIAVGVVPERQAPKIGLEPIEVVVLAEPAATELTVGHRGASMLAGSAPVASSSGASVNASVATNGTSSTASRVASISATPTATISATQTPRASASETAADSDPAIAPRETTGSGAPTSNLMNMRARSNGLDVTAEIAGRIPATPYVAPGEPKISGKLENSPGGGAVVNDTVTTMTVEGDGNITFADKPDIDIQLKLPIPNLDPEQMRQDLGRSLTEWFADPYAATKFGRKAEVSRVWMAVPGACDSWGDVWCDDEMAPKAEKYVRDQKKTGGSILGGSADITAYLHRKYIGDPYASRKLKLLDDTRDERVARGTTFRTQQLLRSAELMGRTLEQLWAREADPVKRRAALFELWDDCDEGPGERGQAGKRARAMITGWIGARLPRGSAEAYTDEEIRFLDARRSSNQPFAPYPAAPPSP